MPDQNKDDLRSRIERLEQKVEDLERLLQDQSSADPIKKNVIHSSAVRPASDQSDSKKISWKERDFQPGEQWLNRIGIGLLLIGVAFLFKYSIDQGWLIPPVRSAIGLGIGLVLFTSGIRMSEEINPLKQILMGGGIAIFYITGFATFQLYAFASGLIIWPFMVIVTLLALSLSLQQDEAVLSVVGTLGALGTPFMLYTGEGSVISLMIYTTLVLTGTSIVYLFKGWKTLLWSIAGGGLVVMYVGIMNTTLTLGHTTTPPERWGLMLGAIIWTISSWGVPTIRAVLTTHNPARWPNPEMVLGEEHLDFDLNYTPASTVHILVFLTPLFFLSLAVGIWNLSMNGAGLTACILAGIGMLGFLILRKEEVPRLTSTHIFMSLVMLTIGFILLLEGNVLFTVLAAEAIALHFVAHQTLDQKVDISAHILFGIVVLWLINLMRFTVGMSFWGLDGVTQLAFIAAGGMLVPRWIEKEDIRMVYRIVCHILFLIWTYQAFSIFENGQAWVTVSWGVYGVALLILGFIRYGRSMRLAGMSTIFLMVGKLFLVDLSQLQAVWRILLFMGFGAIFLFLGYYWQWQLKKENPEKIE